MTNPVAPAPTQPVRAAMLGLSGGMLVGAIFLGVRAAMLMQQECAPGLSAEECHLDETVALELSNFSFIFAVGLLLVGAGLFLLFRKPKESS